MNPFKKIKEKELFEDWQFQCKRLELLNSFIQNDFDKILIDGYVTKEQIKNSIKEFNDLYNEITTNIHTLSVYITELLEEKSK